MSEVLAIDLGKTGCRAALWVGSERLEAEGGGAPGLAALNGAALAEAAILAVARPLLARAGVHAATLVGIGAAGAMAAPDAARLLAGRLLGSLPAQRVMVTSDAIASHAGALGGGAGVVLAVGTGTVAIGVGANGELARVDGWGPWLGDRGSGAWLGLAGLRAALRAEDGRGPATALSEAARARFGTLSELPVAIDGDANPARRAASFAPDVVAAAVAGDAIACALLAQAVHDLAATAHVAAARVGGREPVPLVLIGGLLGVGRALREPLEAALVAGPVPGGLRESMGNALDGARLLAQREDTVHERVVVRVSGGPSPAGLRPARRSASQPDPASGRGEEGLDTLATEGVRPGLEDLDERKVAEVVRLLVGAEADAQAAVARAVPQLAEAAERVAQRLEQGGRLFYLGAGTPGRLATLDAAELGPTYSVPPGLVIALLAGGEGAMTQAVEGAEDDDRAAGAALSGHGLTVQDAVVGITASGRTPYVVGGLHAARAVGALTVAIVNNPASPAAAAAELAIELLTGPEVIAGSTRLTAGTTQKIALNTLSTAVMVRLGKTYGARMVDVRATNRKLRRRVLRMVQEITGAGEEAAAAALAAADGRVKPAVVALLAGVDVAEAERRLDAAGGRVRLALRGHSA